MEHVHHWLVLVAVSGNLLSLLSVFFCFFCLFVEMLFNFVSTPDGIPQDDRQHFLNSKALTLFFPKIQTYTDT